MATRSTIAYSTGRGTVRAVYCHWDGYPEYVGKVLEENYQAAYKICRLIEGGDMSSIGPEPMPTSTAHSFENPQAGVCVYYRRDRGDKDAETQEFDSIQDWVNDYSWSDYFYLWNGKEWLVADNRGEDFTPVTELLAEAA